MGPLPGGSTQCKRTRSLTPRPGRTEKQEINKASGWAGSSREQYPHVPDQVSHLGQPFPLRSARPFSRNGVQEPPTMQTPRQRGRCSDQSRAAVTHLLRGQGVCLPGRKANRTLPVCTGRWEHQGRERKGWLPEIKAKEALGGPRQRGSSKKGGAEPCHEQVTAGGTDGSRQRGLCSISRTPSSATGNGRAGRRQ